MKGIFKSKFFTAVINDKDKKLNWLNCNFFYAGILFMICLFVICYFLKGPIEQLRKTNELWTIIIQSFTWGGGWPHMIGNIMGLITFGVFLERHFGTFKFLGLIFLAIPISNITCAAFELSWTAAGFSSVEYFMYANMLLIMIFNFKHYFVGKWRWVFPVAMIGIMVMMMSWTWGGSGLNGVGMELFCCWKTVGHAGPFVSGLCVGLFANLYNFTIKNRADSNLEKEKTISKPQEGAQEKTNEKVSENITKQKKD